ncbi:DUF3244 domain-containing protein [Bacteroides sp. HPS0048]|jgi:hypothetical protein|uniref:DUF3244 domain-containing protein n=1 Tax=Bacteroides sp. HPS0048 TaxID=1078089 RepID=UPI0035647CEA
MAKLFFFLFIISTALYSQPVAAEEVLKDDVTNGLVWYSIPLRGHSSNSSDDTILRSPALTPVKAFMCEKTMRLDFSSSIKDVIITVVNASTGEVVYSENFATPEVVFINLDAEEAGDYRLDVMGDATALWAEFSL